MSLQKYFEGSWTVSRRLCYRTGGGKGTFEGVATFTPCQLCSSAAAGAQQALLYSESGTVELELPSRMTAEAEKQYAFLFDAELGGGGGAVHFVKRSRANPLPFGINL